MIDAELDELLRDIAGRSGASEVAKRLTDLTISQVAAVSHGAHLHDGFAVIKSLDGGAADPEARLAAMAEAWAARTGESTAKAYAAVLDSPEGAALYAEQDAVWRASDDSVAEHMPTYEQLRDMEIVKSASSDFLVTKAREAFPDLGTPQAVAKFLGTDYGARLYANHEEAGVIR